MRIIALVIFCTGLCINSFPILAQTMNTAFEGGSIGNPKLIGNTVYSAENQSYTIAGAGDNIWFDHDEFWFEHKKIKGDFILSANLAFIGKGVNEHRKIGLMIRSGLKGNATHVSGTVHGDGLTSMQFREINGGSTNEIKTELIAPEFVQIERKGKTVIVRVSKGNKPLVTIAEKEFQLEEEVLAGIFICSHEPDVLEKAKIWNVRLEIPAKAGVNGYQEKSASRLEILDIESGNRKIVYETKEHIEAPNWSRKGDFLIYNAEGKLYRFDLETTEVNEINTDFATSNNNDHGISFDGKTLALSHHLKENGKTNSIIYTVPIEGGIPQRVTQKGPSYWHGWSPDGKWLTYCAEREDNYDVYKIKATGGKEIRLTKLEGLDDGPEYSPDGKYIYFNSVRSGSMEIWRMKPNGNGQEQITNDVYQNWFAHPSPDGNWLIMISYLPEIAAGSHPPNQRVMLRLMSTNGGEIKTVAFLYGGQGTINVPSWSPDSRRVAFVSYTY